MDLIQQLIKTRIISKKQGVQLKTEVRQTKKTQEKIILEKKILAENNLFQLKSELLDIPIKESLPEELPKEVMSIIPKESVEFYKMIPLLLKKEDGILEVGMVYPENHQAQEALKFLTRQQKLSPRIFLITFSNFTKYLSKYQVPKKEVEKALEKLEEEMSPVEKRVEKAEFERLVEEAPIIKMVAVMLRQATEGGASDIHIEPTQEDLRVRYRLDGILHSSLILPLKVHPAIAARIKILSSLKIDETRIPQDGRFSTKIGEQKIDFRVATFPTIQGEKVVLRILRSKEALKSLDKLGLGGQNLNKAEEAIKKPYGMILVTGPTGSGKSTTLYAILKLLNKEEVNIVTIEDPVEYFMDGINQSQVKPDIDYTFARGLRQMLRQDPDIIMVGEIRDRETANLAIHAALTGHLVLSTMHTNTAIGVIPRLVDMKIEPFLIPPTLSLVLSQRLVRVLCPACKKKIKAEEKTKKYILDKVKRLPQKLSSEFKIKGSLFIFEPQGCKKCNSKGYAGRTGIFEVIKMTDTLAKIINQASNQQEMLKEAREQGMITMLEDGIIKVLQGITSLEEVMRIAEEK